MKHKSLRDIGRAIDAERRAQAIRKPSPRRSEHVSLRLSRHVNYMAEGFREDVGFERSSEAKNSKNYVRCLLCWRTGGGYVGRWEDLAGKVTYGWQKRCLNPHLYECACGLFFVTSHQLSMHIVANRRWRHPGHGRMDRVGL